MLYLGFPLLYTVGNYDSWSCGYLWFLAWQEMLLNIPGIIWSAFYTSSWGMQPIFNLKQTVQYYSNDGVEKNYDQ